MKTYCKNTVIDRSHVEMAYNEWLKAPAGKKNAWRVEDEYGGRGVHASDALIDEIASEIRGRCLSFEPFTRYRRQEKGSRKERKISIASVKYQVATYAIKLALDPLLSAKTGYYQCAGVKDKGQKLVRSAIKRWSRDARYNVKLDVRKCYEHITCDLVMSLLGKYVKSDDVLYLAERLLSPYAYGVLEIGTFFSLLMANFVLSFAYHFVESLCKERRGKLKPLVAHQVWHLDDILLVGNDKRDLKMAVRRLAAYMRSELGLELKPWKVRLTSKREPLDMGGFRSWNGHVTLRKRLFVAARKSFLRYGKRKTVTLAARCNAYYGWFKHSDSLKASRNIGLSGLVKSAKKMVSRCSKRKEQSCNTLAAQPS